jgi:hypothetical protein
MIIGLNLVSLGVLVSKVGVEELEIRSKEPNSYHSFSINSDVTRGVENTL